MSQDFGDPEVVGNYIEAVFWITIAAVIGIRGRWSKPPYRGLSVASGSIFFFFGLSDGVEAQTGAWWRPPWLFFWKAACVVGLALCYAKYRQIKKREKAAGGMPGGAAPGNETVSGGGSGFPS